MAIELLLFVLAGCMLGILTGLAPGLHVNTIALIALGFAATNNLGFVLLIASMSIVHTFVDFVPSILLGAPDADTFLSVLPGHRMLLQGKGFLAIKLTVVGGLFGGLGALGFAYIFVQFIEKSKEFISATIPFVLAAVLLLMLFGEPGGKKLWAAVVIGLSSCLGLLALRSSIPMPQPLFCLATGFFAASNLLYSIGKKQVLLQQKISRFFVEKSRVAKNSFLAVIGATLVALLPSISSAEAAFIIRKLSGRIRTADYLILLGGINTVGMLLSFFVLFAWGKTRTGSAVAMKQMIDFGLHELLFVTAACLVALGFGVFAADLTARFLLQRIDRIEYKKINSAVLAFITCLVFFTSGLIGLLFYSTAAAIGLVAVSSGTKRTNTMAFLMVPTILFYLGL